MEFIIIIIIIIVFLLKSSLIEILNPFLRYQKDLFLHDVFPPREDKLCSCGCQRLLIGRQTRWASEECSDKAYSYFSVIKGNTQHIRTLLFERDKGVCQSCGLKHEEWHADHIFPVFKGGGACDLDNFQSLCISCHQEKTYNDSHLNKNSSHAASNLLIDAL